MKKLLLAMGSFLLVAEANAQLGETFNGAGLPAGWSMIKADNHTVSPTGWADPNVPIILTQQAWMKRARATGDSTMLTASNFTNATAKADRWLITPSFTVNNPNMIVRWEDWQSFGAQYNDSIQIWISTTGGATTADFTTMVYNNAVTPFDATPYGVHGASLAAFNGQNIRVAFRVNTKGGAIRLDNVQTSNLSSPRDGGVTKVTFDNIVAQTGSFPVKVQITNHGSSDITTLQLSYKVDNGAPVTQTFSGLMINPLGTANLQFTTPITNPAAGSHTLTVDILQVNGQADAVTSNNQSVRNFAVATAAVPRNGFFEEFTSSTCAPCASFNATFDPLVLAQGGNNPTSRFNIVKYQMNWPNPGNDASYNPDGMTRRSFYGVNAIPDHEVNGMQGGNGDAAEITASKVAPAYITMNGSYTIKGDSLIATVTLTPNFTLPGTDYKLYLAATEASYQNPANTTGQLNYYHVMRKMLPDGNGITIPGFTAGVPQTFTEKFKYNKGSVTQGSYNFWTHPINGNLVAFVQAPASHEVLQSVAIPAKWPTAVGNVASGLNHVDLYPNPARTHTNLVFSLDEAASVSINVVDALGKVVYTKSEKMNSGKQSLIIATDNFAAGIYNVSIATEKGVETQRLTVAK